jgi:protein phosphatase
MGGAAAGEVASQMAVDLIFESLANAPDPVDHNDLARQVIWAVEQAGQHIYEEARSDRSRRGMGTTATVAALMDGRLFLAQVGDSRAYLLRQGRLVQVTRDQSLVNQLLESGQLTEEEAENFEHSNIILQALGTSESVQVDLTYVDLRDGDALLLCSDGLSGMLKDPEIFSVLSQISDPVAACKELTDRANRAGGHDNVTVLLVQFLGGTLTAPVDTDEPLVYRKYQVPKPERRTYETPTQTPAASVPREASPISEEAAKETRELRVNHTVFGVRSELTPSSPAPASASRDSGYGAVEVPTTGLAPRWIGFIVLASLLLLAVVGVILLR